MDWRQGKVTGRVQKRERDEVRESCRRLRCIDFSSSWFPPGQFCLSFYGRTGDVWTYTLLLHTVCLCGVVFYLVSNSNMSEPSNNFSQTMDELMSLVGTRPAGDGNSNGRARPVPAPRPQAPFAKNSPVRLDLSSMHKQSEDIHVFTRFSFPCRNFQETEDVETTVQ